MTLKTALWALAALVSVLLAAAGLLFVAPGAVLNLTASVNSLRTAGRGLAAGGVLLRWRLEPRRAG